MKKPKGKRLEKDEYYKKKQSEVKTFEREQRHFCRLGTAIPFKGETCLIGLSTPLFIFLFTENGKHYKLTWAEWDKEIENKWLNQYFNFTPEVIKEMGIVRRNFKYQNKIKKKIAVNRTPKPKRFPVKFEGGIK